MKNKQIIGIVISGIVFIAVGVTGILSNVVSEKLTSTTKTQEKSTESMVESLLGKTTGDDIDLPDGEYVGMLNITGVIQASSAKTSLTSNGYNHDLYMNYVTKMESDSNNKGILLYVDSPGGTVYQSDEMYLKLMEYKEKTKRPIYAYFASEACSGAYYISMSADKIYANRNCWTGSIGVIVSMINLKKLYDKLGVKEIDITSGVNKAMGSQGKDLTAQQQEILQKLVDEAYDQFTDIVSTGRNMDIETVKKLADGRIYSAAQAKENGLIDEIGSLEDEKAAFAKAGKFDSDIEYYAPDSSMSEMLSSILGTAEKYTKKSDLQLAKDIIENTGNGELMYYAE